MPEQSHEILFKPLQESSVRVGLRNGKIALGGDVSLLTADIRDYIKNNLLKISESAKTIQKQYDYGWQQQLSNCTALTNIAQSGSLIKSPASVTGLPGSQQSVSAFIACGQTHSAIQLDAILRASWAVVLHRYTGSSQVAFLAAENAATGASLTQCVDQLPVAVLNPVVDSFDVAAGNSFQALVNLAIAKRISFQEIGYPSQKLLEAELLPHSLDASLLVINDGRLTQDKQPEQLSVFFDIPAKQFVYVIQAVCQADGISLQIHFDAGRASTAAAQRIATYYANVISACLDNESLGNLIGDYDFLAQTDRTLLLHDWAGPELDVPAGLSVAHLFAQQVEQSPEAIFLDDGVNTLGYGDAHTRINTLILALQEAGVQPGEPVGLYMAKSIELVIAVFALMKAGYTYVPIDKAIPAERIQAMCESAQLRWVVSDSIAGKATLGSLQLPQALAVLLFDELTLVPRAVPDLPVVCKPDGIAYIIYTSGSTGVPKGVAVPHSALTSFLLHCQQTYTAAELRSVLFSSRICFDLSIFELFSSFLHGGKLFIVQDILELIDKRGQLDISCIMSVPSVMAQVLDAGSLPPSVLTLHLGGEPLRKSLVERVFAQSAVTRLYNVYGPTESTVFSTTSLILGAMEAEPVIGKPVTNTRTLVLDPSGNLLPPGVVGELYLVGTNTARGYVNAEALTAERFKPGSKYCAHAPMYRTGDFVRWNDQGELEFIGRRDQQIKLNGFRIELEEIEVQLLQHPHIKLAAVKKIERLGDTILVAWYTTQSNINLSRPELRSFLKQYLPVYMLPSLFIEVAQMPLNVSGKIDRRQLNENLMNVNQAY